jgi:hypothetical protein
MADHAVQCCCGAEFSVSFAHVSLPDLMRSNRPISAAFETYRAQPEASRQAWLEAFLGRSVPVPASLERAHSHIVRQVLAPFATGGDYECSGCGRAGIAPLDPGFGALGEDRPVAACPFCGAKLRTRRAKQCFVCKADWHADAPKAG